MRRVFICSLIVFLVVAGVMIYMDEEQPSTVQILSLYQRYSRVITSAEEHITIPIHISTEDSFLTDIDSIESSMIYDNQNQMLVVIDDIIQTADSSYFQGNTYYPYELHISFDLVQLNAIDFINAFLQIRYHNGDQIALEIGSMYLNFEPIQNEEHIDMMRLFCTVKTEGEQNYISGIVIGVENRSSLDTKIVGIDCLVPGVQFDLGSSVPLSEAPAYDTDVNEILGYSYDAIHVINDDEAVSLEDDNLLYIPIAYQEQIIPINRFPLIIHYTYLNEPYTFIVDDFLFYSSDYSLEANDGQIREYIYHY